MSHKHDVYDTDPHFKIDGNTRAITNISEVKTVLVKGDHNSERFSFELPKMIDGHDMLLCDSIQIHYLNIDSSTRESCAGIYEVDDIQASSSNDDTVVFSWLISGNAIQYVGPLSFSIRFICTTDGEVDYSWNTVIFSGINVSDSISNGDVVINNYVDILEKWKADIFGSKDGAVKDVVAARDEALTGIEQAKVASVNAVTAEGDKQIGRVQEAANGNAADREQIAANKAGLEAVRRVLDSIRTSINLLSPQNGKIGGFYGVAGNGFWTENDHFATIFISVKENTKYCYTNSNSSYVYFFTDKIDEFGRYKSLYGTSGIILGSTKAVQGNRVVEIQTPSNCKYCAINIETTLFNSNDTIMFVECELNDFPTKFIPNTEELASELQKSMRFEYSPILEKTKNLFSTSLGKLGGRYIDGTGAWQNNGYYATVYIPVKENSAYIYLQKGASTVLFLSMLNENIKYKNIEDTSIILGTHNAKDGINTFTTPSQCKYVALSYSKPYFVDGEIMFIEGDQYPKDFIEYGYDISNEITLQRVKDDVNKIIEKKIPSTKTNILLLGDSITALCGKPTQDNSAWYRQTRGWIKYFNDVMPINLVDNTAVAGNTLLGGTSLKAQVDVILGKEYDVEPELIIIFIGTNDILDSRVNTPIEYNKINEGYYNSDNELINVDTVSVDTFVGAFRYATEKLLNKFTQAQMVWCAPIAANELIRKRTTMITIVENFNKITEFAGIGYIRTDKCGICGWRENKSANGNDLIDGIHPNENGARKLGRFIAHEVKKYL